MRYLSFIIILATTFTFGQLPMEQRLDSLFTNMNSDKEFNGVVLVARNDSILFEKAYGMSDFEKSIPLTTASVFDLASVSKQFTAMGIIQLAKEGKLSYEDKMVKYLPELSQFPDVTIHHLLTHTAGLPDYLNFMEEFWDTSNYATNNDVINTLVSQQLVAEFPAGEQYEYSNTGYLLLASIIEKISDMTYGDYLEKTIFKPLNLEYTTVNRPRYAPKNIENLTIGYISDMEDGGIIAVNDMGMSFFQVYLDGIVGDGMVNSTVNDLYKWSESLTTNVIMNDDDRETMFANYTTNDGSPIGYGYGLQIQNSEKYGKIIAHSGGWAGYANYMEKHLDKDLTFIMLQNASLISTRVPVGLVRKILYQQPIEQVEVINYSLDDLKVVSGAFTNDEIGFTITTFEKDGQFYGQATGQGAFALTGYADYVFKFKEADITITFNEDQSELYLEQGKVTTTFKK